MTTEEEFRKLLKETRAVLIRQNRHNVYRLPNGMTFGFSKTPSCPFAWKHATEDLRRVAGLQKPPVIKGKNRGQNKPGATKYAGLSNVPIAGVSPNSIKMAIENRLIAKSDFETLMQLQGVKPIDKERV